MRDKLLISKPPENVLLVVHILAIYGRSFRLAEFRVGIAFIDTLSTLEEESSARLLHQTFFRYHFTQFVQLELR